LKNKAIEGDLGRLTGTMLRELRDRGPDSAGFAVYGKPKKGITKICAIARNGAVRWDAIAQELGKALGARVSFEEIEDHAVFETRGPGGPARKCLIDHASEAIVLSQGQSIEIYKGVGDPGQIAERLDLDEHTGTHAIGHTRMATESAVTI